MTQFKQIQQLLQSNNLWKDGLTIRINPNKRGQSISYFIYDSNGTALYIAKFFDYFKNISIPPSIDINSCQTPEDVIDMLADADDFMDNIDDASNIFYYQRRAFLRYIQVCSKEDTGFPKMIAAEENIIINSHFYGLLIEEAINGITLEEYLKSSSATYKRVDFAITFLEKMAKIIQKFVSHGIVHRDLSPDNIMISHGEFIVIDPGVVKIVNRNTTDIGYIMGKRSYASPEQYWGYAVNADFTSDLYTVGLIMFEIVAGTNPLMHYISTEPSSPHIALMRKLDRELEDIFFTNIDETPQTLQLYMILRKLLQVDKIYRFDDISSLLEAITVLKEEE